MTRKCSAAQRGNAEVAQKEYMERLSQVWAKHNSHPLKSLASLMVQAPVFICFFSALRHMAAAQARSNVQDNVAADRAQLIPLREPLHRAAPSLQAAISCSPINCMQNFPRFLCAADVDCC